MPKKKTRRIFKPAESEAKTKKEKTELEKQFEASPIPTASHRRWMDGPDGESRLFEKGEEIPSGWSER